MNNLQVETIKLEPAKVEFNHEQIERELEENLKKYEGLTFTEESTKELRATLAELRKGKKAVDEYRKKIKKELTEPVKKFENKCKDLNKRFDNVINPLKEQLDDFETKRREEKTTEIENLITQIITDYELTEQFAKELVVEDEMLAKSRSMKSIEDTLAFKASHLKTQQDKLETDKKLIDSNVRALNAEHGTEFIAEPYIRLLEFEEIDTVLEKMKNHVLAVVKRREEERKQKEIKEVEKETDNGELEYVPPFLNVDFEEDKQDDNNLMPDPFLIDKEVIYRIIGTDDDHKRIMKFLFDLDVAVSTDE